MHNLLKLFIVALFLTCNSCKNDVPNPAPQIVLESPTSTNPNKNLQLKKIPLKVSVYDKDGLSDVSVDIMKKYGGTGVVQSINLPAVTNGTFLIDTNFMITDLFGRDSMDFWVVIKATDAGSNSSTLTSPFKVYKK
jgi:hypothetical protein